MHGSSSATVASSIGIYSNTCRVQLYRLAASYDHFFRPILGTIILFYASTAIGIPRRRRRAFFWVFWRCFGAVLGVGSAVTIVETIESRSSNSGSAAAYLYSYRMI